VLFADARRGACIYCEAKICIPRSYFRRATIPSVVFTILFVVKTFPMFVKSSASFPLFMLWLVLVFGVLNVAILLLTLLALRLAPPTVERIHSNDTFTKLRLGD